MFERLKYQIDFGKLSFAVCGVIDLEFYFLVCFFSFHFIVLDDEDSNNITVGSLVTVLVKLTRQTMAVSKLFLCVELCVKVFIFIFSF